MNLPHYTYFSSKCLPFARDYFVLPSLSDEGYRVTVLRVRDTNPDKFSIQTIARRILMVLDVRLTEETCLSNIMIIDLQVFHIAYYALHRLAASISSPQPISSYDVKSEKLRELSSYVVRWDKLDSSCAISRARQYRLVKYIGNFPLRHFALINERIISSIFLRFQWKTDREF